MLDPAKCLDLIQTIETVRLYARWFDEQATKTLSCIQVSNDGTEVKGFWSKEQLALMEQSSYLIATYQPFLKEKLDGMIQTLKGIEKEIQDEKDAFRRVPQPS